MADTPKQPTSSLSKTSAPTSPLQVPSDLPATAAKGGSAAAKSAGALGLGHPETSKGPSEPRRTASGAPKPDKPKLHPLQHVWSLYFDSKTMQSNSASPSPNPTSASPAGSAAGDKDPKQQHTLPASSSTLQPPSSTSKPGTALSSDSWEAQLKFLGKYNTVEAFFKTFATLRRPSSLDRHSNYHLFKDGIKPMWEDPANAKGGKWVLTLRGTNPALLDRTWMWLVLALIGEDLDDRNDITGAVCSTRPKGDRIALWVRIKDDIERVNTIGRKLVSLLDVEKEPGVSLEFVSNSEGRRGSAFRSHGGHHNNMREATAGKEAEHAGASSAIATGVAAAAVESSPKTKDETTLKEADTNKGDESTGSVVIKASPATRYISFSNPPPQFGPGQGPGGGLQHGPGGFPPQQQPGMPGSGFMNGPVMAGGMPGMPFPPGFLPPGLNPQQMGMMNGTGGAGGMGMFVAGGAAGGPLSPQYLAAAAATAGIAPQNMHYLQHQLALQQQAYFIQAQQLAAAQLQQQQQQQHQKQRQLHPHGHPSQQQATLGQGIGRASPAFGSSPEKSGA